MMNNLEVMDETAITLCKENNIPVVVFNLTRPGNIVAALMGNSEIGTCIEGSGSGSSGDDGEQDSDHQEW